MDSEPVVRVVRGAPTPEEVAAVLAVLSLRRAAPPTPVAVSKWARSGRPGASRWSARRDWRAGRPGQR